MSSDRSRPSWSEALQDALGTPALRSWTPVAGGDIGESHCVELASGDRVFLKRYGEGLPGIASSEARGLAWLGEAKALRVPEILATGENWLALEWIESAPRARDFDERLGVGLARLHAAGADRFGLDRDNWIGRLPQCNEAHENWSAFYVECRLRPLQRHATRDGTLPATLASRLDRLIDGLAERVGPSEPPARLHGDLWSGNLIADETGSPCLIDPAVYGGHREMDLAMMKLFGGFDRRSFEAYDEAHPLAPAAEARVPLYQVYPLLVHVCLFGRGYLDSLAHAVEQSLSIPR